MIVIIANILGLISALIMIYAGSIKEKNKVLKYHTIHAFFGMSCDLLLGGYPSVIIIQYMLSLVCHVIYY